MFHRVCNWCPSKLTTITKAFWRRSYVADDVVVTQRRTDILCHVVRLLIINHKRPSRRALSVLKSTRPDVWSKRLFYLAKKSWRSCNYMPFIQPATLKTMVKWHKTALPKLERPNAMQRKCNTVVDCPVTRSDVMLDDFPHNRLCKPRRELLVATQALCFITVA